jgi:hypothetical protein
LFVQDNFSGGSDLATKKGRKIEIGAKSFFFELNALELIFTIKSIETNKSRVTLVHAVPLDEKG